MNKTTLKHIVFVSISNLTTIIAGIIAGFVIPKIMEVSDYGYYKTFTLYSSYIGLLSLGIVDGIVLKYGNKNLEELQNSKIRSITKIYNLINIMFCIIGIIISLLFLKGNSRYLMLFVSLNIPATNFVGYFQQISQITQRFKEYSIRNVIKSILNILIVIILVIFTIIKVYNITYKIYVIFLLITSYILMIWYIITYKQLIFGSKEKITTVLKDISGLIKLGFPLLFANLCSTLILTIDRQFINIIFDSSTYAIYAFAYNLLSLVTIAISAIATVLFPALKRTDKTKALNSYRNYVSIILSCIFLTLTIYFPLSGFIQWFLPKYTNSIVIFRVIFPGLAISSVISIIMHNYYKILNKSLTFFIKSIISLGVSALFNYIAYMIFKTPISISIASIFSLLIWYIITDNYFKKEHNINNRKNFIYLLINIIIFYACTVINNLIISGIIYILLITITTLIFQKQEIKEFINKIK